MQQFTEITLQNSWTAVKDSILKGFVKINRQGQNEEITFEDLQISICDIQLIPQVPEEVKSVFNAAKKLHVFGYFDYYFFTISQHYAYLALESALKNKYNAEIKPVKRTHLIIVIDELTVKGFIPKQLKSFYIAGKNLRNSLSHLTKPPILMPNSSTISSVANYINLLFDK